MALTLPDAGFRMTALVRHNTTLMFREPGPIISRLVQPLVLITLMHPARSRPGG
jgi:ABC-2 type transport system permease protein